MKKIQRNLILSTLCAITLFMGESGYAQVIPDECNTQQCSPALQNTCCPYIGDCSNPNLCYVCGGNCGACVINGWCGWSKTEKGKKEDKHGEIEKHNVGVENDNTTPKAGTEE
ncbi:MAG: hypothetical protein K2Y08_00905 [Alphaproteobacteria bacterium]|nr:hypothetical protein [Alphaproteobacteria bacterium]